MRFFFTRFRPLDKIKPYIPKPGLWKLGLFFVIMGPGIITGVVDNDIGGIATYSSAGASYGYELIWVVLFATVPLAIIQEMNARMGAVTGKGLAALIRESFGLKITFYALIALLLANISNIIAEFAGIAAGGEIFGISRWILVPIAAVLVSYVVLAGSYRKVEKILLIFCLFYIAYILAGFLAKPDWIEAARGAVVPSIDLTNVGMVTMAITIIGTTIAPWMQFYQQAAVAEKKIPLKDYNYEKWDTYIGAFLTEFVAFFIVLATAATLYKNGIVIETAGDAAKSLIPLAGKFAGAFFAFGLINAGFMAAAVLPASTAYSLAEGFGWNSGMDKGFKGAPRFYLMLVGLIVFSAAAVMTPKLNLIKIMIFSQTVNGLLLPVILILMLIIVNDKKVMGKHTNTKTQNIITIATVAGVIILTISLVLFTIIGR